MTCIPVPNGVMCIGTFSEPTDTQECSEVMNSFGKSCRTCDIASCYRNGWKEPQVRVDNRRISQNKMTGIITKRVTP